MFIKFKNIKFKNLRSYSNQEVELKFDRGLTLISGDNGAGKTSMLEALCYNLYGKPYSKIKLAALINRFNKKGLYTESEFEIGKDTYNIVRGMKPNILKLRKNGEDTEVLSSTSLSQDDIDKIIGIDYKMFKNVISLSASNKPFLDKDTSKADRREIIETIFNINIFAKMLKNLKKNITSLKTDVEIGASNIKNMEENINTDNARIKEIKDAEKEFDTNKENDLDGYTSSIKVYEKDIEKEEDAIKEYEEELIEDKQQHIKDIDILKNNISTEYTRIEDEITKFKISSDEKLNEYSNDITKLNVEIYNKNIEFTSIREDIKEKEKEHNTKISNFEVDYDKLVVKLNEKASKIEIVDISKIEDVGDEKNTLISEINICSNNIKENNKLIKFYEENDTCDQCKHDITLEEKNNFIKEKTDSNLENNTIIDSHNKKIAELNIIIDEDKEKRKEKSDLDIKIDKASTIKENQMLVLGNNKKSEIDALESKINESYVTSLEIKIETIKSNQDNHNTLVEKEIESIKNNSKVKEFDIELKNLKEKDIEVYGRNAIENCKSNIITYKKHIISSKEKIEEINKREFTLDTKDLEVEFKSKCSKYKIKYGEYKKDTDRLLVYNLTKDILSDGGIKTHFFSKLIPILNQKINIYLDKFNLPISLSFDNEMNVTISSLTGRDENIEYSCFSGGERKRIDISILFALIDLMKIITNWNCNIILADEMLDSGGLDASGISIVMNSIKEMVDKTSNLGVYIVSHKINEEHKSVFNNIWKVTKVNQFSEIEFL